MLKRYTHLRAARLVHKLDGPRVKTSLAILRNLVPYPGIVTTEPEQIRIHFPDFESQVVAGRGATLQDAVEAARNALLQTLVGSLRFNHKIPQPDQYLMPYPGAQVLMVNPIAQAA
jgi:hypothetical protein